MDNDKQDTAIRAERLNRLSGAPRRAARVNQTYSRLVKALRFILPVAAIAIIGVVLSWPKMEQSIQPVTVETVKPGTIVRNELINPHFESADRKNNPFTVTATRAFQSTSDPGVILLEDPKGVMTPADQPGMTVTAANGVYREGAEKLTLDGNVRLLHDQGYEMTAQRLMVDFREQNAWSDENVSVKGADGTIEASGMKLEGQKGILVFTGPAKLTLRQALKGF